MKCVCGSASGPDGLKVSMLASAPFAYGETHDAPRFPPAGRAYGRPGSERFSVVSQQTGCMCAFEPPVRLAATCHCFCVMHAAVGGCLAPHGRGPFSKRWFCTATRLPCHLPERYSQLYYCTCADTSYVFLISGWRLSSQQLAAATSRQTLPLNGPCTATAAALLRFVAEARQLRPATSRTGACPAPATAGRCTRGSSWLESVHLCPWVANARSLPQRSFWWQPSRTSPKLMRGAVLAATRGPRPSAQQPHCLLALTSARCDTSRLSLCGANPAEDWCRPPALTRQARSRRLADGPRAARRSQQAAAGPARQAGRVDGQARRPAAGKSDCAGIAR